MTVGELIIELQKFDPQTMIVVSGYEGGYTENVGIFEKEIYLNVFDECYYGHHGDEFDASYRKKETPYEKVNAVVISR